MLLPRKRAPSMALVLLPIGISLEGLIGRSGYNSTAMFRVVAHQAAQTPRFMFHLNHYSMPRILEWEKPPVTASVASLRATSMSWGVLTLPNSLWQR